MEDLKNKEKYFYGNNLAMVCLLSMVIALAVVCLLSMVIAKYKELDDGARKQAKRLKNFSAICRLNGDSDISSASYWRS